MKMRLLTAGLTLLITAFWALQVNADDKAAALDTNNCAPSGDLRGDAERGAALHMENCAECHGYDGKAEVIVMHMDEPPRDETDVEYMKTLSDLFMYLAICKGGEQVGRSLVMPAWGDFFTDQEIRDLIAHVRTFSGT
jgi:mono/diheme cytochrome c family protein